MRLRSLLEIPDLKLELLYGESELERRVRSVMTTDLPDPSRYLSEGALVLTGMVWRRGPADSTAFVRFLSKAGIAALGAGEGQHGHIPADLVEACRAAGMPLLRVPADVAFSAVTEQIVRRLSGVLAEDFIQFLGRHRDLISAATAPGSSGLGAVLELVNRQLSLRSWVMTATGRMIASSGAELPESAQAKALRHYLSGQRLPDGDLSVICVGDPARPRVVNWLMVCDSDATGKPHLIEELTALIAAEQERLEKQSLLRRPAADELIKMITSDALPLPQLRLAGLPVEGTFTAVAACLEGSPELARSILEELVHPLPVALMEDLAITIVPGLAEQVQRARKLAPALKRTRLRIGVSGPAAGVPGLRGALDEARYACTLGGLSKEPVTITGHEDLSSHMLLLAAVPDDVRRAYRQRLLGPVIEYDRQHRADLIPTLRAFLAHSGSWTKCAEELHVHVNTLRYRIHRIEQMTGLDLGKLEHRVDLFLALALAGK